MKVVMCQVVDESTAVQKLVQASVVAGTNSASMGQIVQPLAL
jgi:hypothetical protein